MAVARELLAGVRGKRRSGWVLRAAKRQSWTAVKADGCGPRAPGRLARQTRPRRVLGVLKAGKRQSWTLVKTDAVVWRVPGSCRERKALLPWQKTLRRVLWVLKAAKLQFWTAVKTDGCGRNGSGQLPRNVFWLVLLAVAHGMAVARIAR